MKYKNYYIKNDNFIIYTYLIDKKEELIKNLDEAFIQNTFILIQSKMSNKLNNFVFPILKNDAFRDINSKNDFTKISVYQYKMIKHATIVYNRILKVLQQRSGISTPLTSHVARHSFTNLLLTLEDVNLYDLSQSLGHSSISITENHIKSGFNLSRIDDINKKLSNKFGR